MEIFNVIRGPAPYDGGYRNEDNDETKYCVLPPDPLIMMFTGSKLLPGSTLTRRD